MVASGGEVPIPAFAHDSRVEDAFVPQLPLVEEVFRPWPQWTAQPDGQGTGESLLGAIDQLRRNVAV